MSTWEDLEYWRSGEWQWVQEKLDEMDRAGVLYNPPRHLLFKSMDSCPFDKVRVAIIGQDPYPSRNHATGVAFSVPEDLEDFPPTLLNIFDELVSDLGVNYPVHGNLIPWCAQGVFLWNATPSCATGLPASHHWWEWSTLTAEIIKKLNEKEIDVFVFMGNYAQGFAKYVTKSKTEVGSNCNNVIFTSHPSPLGQDKGKTPFKGSRVFSTINSYLNNPVDWRLDDGLSKNTRDNFREGWLAKAAAEAIAEAQEASSEGLLYSTGNQGLESQASA